MTISEYSFSHVLPATVHKRTQTEAEHYVTIINNQLTLPERVHPPLKERIAVRLIVIVVKEVAECPQWAIYYLPQLLQE